DPGAGAVLVEEVHHGPPAQRRQLLDLPLLGGGHPLGDVEHRHGAGAIQVGGRQEVPHQRVLAGRRPVAGTGAIRTSSTPSTSVSRTLTRSSSEVGRFLPTWSAR